VTILGESSSLFTFGRLFGQMFIPFGQNVFEVYFQLGVVFARLGRHFVKTVWSHCCFYMLQSNWNIIFKNDETSNSLKMCLLLLLNQPNERLQSKVSFKKRHTLLYKVPYKTYSFRWSKPNERKIIPPTLP
jgi:hypothetical protein